METLKLLSNGIQGTASRDVVVQLIASFVSLQENVSERQLLESLPDCLACLEGMEHADRNDIRLVLEKTFVARCSIYNVSIIRRRFARLVLLGISRNTPIWLPVVSVSFGRDSVSGTFASSRAGPKTRCLLWESVTACASIDQCVARRRLGSSSGKMLFSRTRIKRGAPDSLADPLRTGALSADLSNVAGERKGRPYVWNGIFARDQKSSRARCDGAAGINRRAHTCAFECGRSRGLAADSKSRAQRSARDDFVVRSYTRIAQANRRDIRSRQTVAVALWATRSHRVSHSEAATGNNFAVAR